MTKIDTTKVECEWIPGNLTLSWIPKKKQIKMQNNFKCCHFVLFVNMTVLSIME